jgi:hypothetical protein
MAPSRTGNGTHGQGIGDDALANTAAKKAEDAAEALAKELKAMRAHRVKIQRAHRVKIQREADAQYAVALCTRVPSMACSINLFRRTRRLEANPYAKLRDLEQR